MGWGTRKYYKPLRTLLPEEPVGQYFPATTLHTRRNHGFIGLAKIQIFFSFYETHWFITWLCMSCGLFSPALIQSNSKHGKTAPKRDFHFTAVSVWLGKHNTSHTTQWVVGARFQTITRRKPSPLRCQWLPRRTQTDSFSTQFCLLCVCLVVAVYQSGTSSSSTGPCFIRTVDLEKLRYFIRVKQYQPTLFQWLTSNPWKTSLFSVTFQPSRDQKPPPVMLTSSTLRPPPLACSSGYSRQHSTL